MKFLIILILFISSCESYIYDSYKIVDLKKNKYFHKSKYPQRYLVKKGDNLYSISRKFKIPIQELISVNNVNEPYKIFPGEQITLPSNKIHIISKGDTLYSISRKYETDVFTLSKLNNIANVNNLFIGQKLKIPKKKLKIKDKSKKKYKSKKNISNEKKLDLKKNVSSTQFIWPVQGKLISKYGKTKEGFYNDGININSKRGVNVKSSDDGKVIYSGNEIPGYGNLILIKHEKNWITAYAHLDKVYIEKGKKVKKGEKIGSVGNTGNVRSPQLHFEIRKGKESVDPLRFL